MGQFVLGKVVEGVHPNPPKNEVNGEECCLISNPTPWFCLLTTTPLEGIGILQSVGDIPGFKWSSTDCEGQD